MISETTLNTRIVHNYLTETEWEDYNNKIPLAGELFIYAPEENIKEPRLKIGDGKSTVGELPFITGKLIDQSSVVQVPKQKNELTYDGSSKSPEWSNIDNIRFPENIEGTNAGMYTVTVTPYENFTWPDGTTRSIDITWVIQKAQSETPTVEGA